MEIGREKCRPSHLCSTPRRPCIALPTCRPARPRAPCRAANANDGAGLPPHEPALPHAQPSMPGAPPSLLSKAQGFALANFMPLALSSALALGVAAPQLGAAAARTQLQTYVVIAIFITSGLQIKRGEALQALKSAGSVAYGLVSILLLSPLLAPLVLSLPLQPSALALGPAVFLCGPTALSAGIAMTQTLGGNVAMAIMLTVSSNILAVFTMPLILPLVLGSAAGGLALDSLALLKQLVQLVLMPTLLGMLIRANVPGAAATVDNNRQAVSCFSALCLAAVPWMQVSKALSQGAAGLSFGSLALSAACGISMHILLLAANATMVKLLHLGGRDDPVQALKIQQAVVLLSSQKTLPVAVTVLSKLSSTLGESVGLAAMTAVFCHLSQIVVDSFLVSWWLKTYGRIGEGKPKAA